MVRKEDTHILVQAEREANKISLRTLIASLVFGILLLSLLIYGFIVALNLKSSAQLDPLESDDIDADVTPNAGSSVCPEVDFDYLLLAVRWPPADCTKNKCIKDIPDQWLIHGLWPNYADGSWPEFCCKEEPFDEAAIRPLEDRLDGVWPNLLKGQSEDSLWQHEWDKHGTCTTKNPQIRGEFKYFNYTLSLFDRAPVKKWLDDAQISPGSEPVSRSDVKAILRQKFGKEVTVHCVSEGRSRRSHGRAGGRALMNLESIHFCYDKNEISPIDCLDQDNCPEEFIFPSEA